MNRFVTGQLDKVKFIFDRWMEKRAEEVRFPEDTECVENIPYLDTGLDCHKMDIYRPKGAAEKLPVVINFHGGGMLLCTRKVNRLFCAEIARRGYLVFCVDYPLVPEKNVPEILADAARGMDRAGELIDRFGGDPGRVSLVGDSAGAFLGTYEIAARKNPAVAQALGIVPTAVEVKAAALISGMFYTARMDSVGAFLRKDFYGRDWKIHPFRPYMSPDVQEVAGAMPPAMLITAKLDNLRNYTLDFAKGLEKAGVSCRVLDYPADKDMSHDFVIIKPEAPKAQRAIDEICAFLRKY